MRVGLVSPYSFDAPGGVQFHIRDLAEELISRGHEVSVLAPADETSDLPPFVVPAGGSVAVPYNGSVARLSFGTAAAARVARWLEEFPADLVHIHEPLSPSLGLLALWKSRVPVVATFHSSQDRSRALSFVAPAVQPSLEKIAARIAVSEAARRTVADHLGGDAVVIPNGVFVDRFSTTPPDPRFLGARHGGVPTICFLGRLDEPRKGLPVLVDAVATIRTQHPDARVLIAGAGEAAEARSHLASDPRVEFLGHVSEADKRALFASVDVYVAPQTGGESFGIVLVEAMAGGTRVVASAIPAFRAVLDDGRVGHLFRVGDPADLARAVDDALGHPVADEQVRAWVRRFDWSVVADRVLEVYETVIDVARVDAPPIPRRRWWRRG